MAIISYVVSLHMRTSLTLFLLLFGLSCEAQLNDAFRQYYSEKPFKKDADGIYYNLDAQRLIFFSTHDSIYQVYSKAYELQEQGHYTMTAPDSIGRHGLCTELYSTGKVKAIGNYIRNKPVGEWNRYYPSGKLMANYTIKIVSKNLFNYSGVYNEYYENGQARVKGNYAMAPNEDSTLEDTFKLLSPSTGEQWTRLLTKFSDKVGIWYYYNEKGEQTGEEEY